MFENMELGLICESCDGSLCNECTRDYCADCLAVQDNDK
jgi:hypothetical protein